MSRSFEFERFIIQLCDYVYVPRFKPVGMFVGDPEARSNKLPKILHDY